MGCTWAVWAESIRCLARRARNLTGTVFSLRAFQGGTWLSFAGLDSVGHGNGALDGVTDR